MGGFFGDLLIPALGIGALYGLVGISFNLIFAPAGVFNFAQGQIVMLGGLLALSLYQQRNWSFALTLVVIAVIGAVIALIEERVAVWPALRRDPRGVGWVLSTLAIFIVIQNISIVVWGSTPQVVKSFPGLSQVRHHLGGIPITPYFVGTLIISVIVFICLHVFVRRSMLGRAIAAVAQDRDAAALRGIDVRFVTSFSFMLGGALATLTGMLAAPLTLATITVGLTFTFRGFTATALGGMGHNGGALVGGLILGVLEQVTQRYWQGGYVDLVILITLLMLLLVRPSGLFGRTTVRRV